jgi:hypothetical protein
MEVSAEIRWFWQGTGPANLQEWFTSREFHECAAGGGSFRIDAYLHDPEQVELGIKLRGKKSAVEVKGLVAGAAACCPNYPFAGPIEIWSKWSSTALSLTGAEVIRVSKRRWMRMFENAGAGIQEIALDAQEHPINGYRLPDEGCYFEYTELSVDGFPPWITLGFEAFGSLKTVAGNLLNVTARLSQRGPPPLTWGWCGSYPAWLQRLAAQSRQ